MKSKHIYLGNTRFQDNFFDRKVFTKSDQHLLTVGCPGSGKSIVSIYPNLATYTGSMFVIDPKAEHCTMFARRRKELGNKVYVIDPYKIAKGRSASECRVHYNLLSELDIEHKSYTKYLSAVAYGLIPPTPSNNNNNKYWDEISRLILEAVITLVVSSYPKEKHTLSFVRELLVGYDLETGRADPERMDKLIVEMFKNNACNGLIQQAATVMDNAGEKEFGIFISDIIRALKWTSDTSMGQDVAQSGFRFADFQDQKATVFIALPFGNMGEQMRWLRSIVGLSHRIFEDFGKKPSPRLISVLDEIYQYGKDLVSLDNMSVTLRAAGVRLWPFVQNISQLKACFSDTGLRNFEVASTIQAYGVRDNDTAEWLTKKMGNQIEYERTGRLWSKKREVKKHIVPLMDASKILNTFQKNIPYELVFPPEGQPMFLERMAFKPMNLEGRQFRGLSLAGTYDGF